MNKFGLYSLGHLLLPSSFRTPVSANNSFIWPMAVWFSRCSRSACGNPCWMKCGKKRDCPHIFPGLALGDRFIPAFAGNACRPSAGRCWRTVHPRVCGERAGDVAATLQRLGSSPRLRGTPLRQWTDRWRLRFIPAFAGNASLAQARCREKTVHPRVCGERACVPSSIITLSGSSPRLRGTPVGQGAERLGKRFIPAFAGNAATTIASLLLALKNDEQKKEVFLRIC